MFWFKNPVDENETLVVKPMNCPESTYIYNSKIRSYRDLPLRLAEIGRLHRSEISKTLVIIKDFYKKLGFEPRYCLATRPEKALGDKKTWDIAETALKEALEKNKIKYAVAEGEGAFYGPKIEVHIDDSHGRDWQLGTAQLDLVMLPEKFDLSYIDEHSAKIRPIVIHRAIFGSFERFIGILLEHFDGALPFWLSPVQVQVLTINDKVSEYAKRITAELKSNNIRTELDLRNESVGKKIREAELQKIPYLLVIGEKEAATGKVAVRERGKGDVGQMAIESFLATLLL